MSFFLLEEEAINKILFLNSPKPPATDHTNTSQQRKFHQQSIKQLKNLAFVSTYSLRQMQDARQYDMIFQRSTQRYKMLLQLRINKQDNSILHNLRIINPNNTFFKIRNIKSSRQLSLKISNFMNSNRLPLGKVFIDMKTGEIRVNHSLDMNCKNLIEFRRGQSLFGSIIAYYVQPLRKLFDFVIEAIVQNKSVANAETNRNRILQNIFRYSQMIHMNHVFRQSSISSQLANSDSEILKKESIQFIIKNKVALDQYLLTNNRLFEHTDLLNKNQPVVEKDFFLIQQEIKYIHSHLSMPTQLKQKTPYQNFMILNHIYVHDICNLRLNKVRQGGFCSIYQTEIKYYYVYSSEEHQKLFPDQIQQLDGQKKMVQKSVIIKKEEEGFGKRNYHQIQILKKIKNGLSVYLPKYYLVINKLNPYSDSIFMDYIQNQNLKDYLSLANHSVTLTSKLFLIFSIIQAVRYIRNYDIVHLDLKPSNIMMHLNMMIKLIDFGESYHQGLCSKKHRPGFSVPYSSPEVYTQNTFTVKSDIFSLGVIMYEMLYNVYPFDIQSQEQSDALHLMQNYLKKWFFCPEEAETTAEVQILRILNLIISKCLHPDPKLRPQIDMLGLIVKLCFFLLQ